jgi:putative RecB family exonuclease
MTSGYDRRSVSQLGTFSACGEQYRLEKVARAPRTPAAWFIQGTAFHAAVELWEEVNRSPTEADLSAAYLETWDAEFQHYLEKEPDISKWMTGGRTLPKNDIATRKERGWNQVLAYVEWARSQADKWRILELASGEPAVEVPFEIMLGNVKVVGAIDQVIEWRDGRITPRDLKTGTKLPAWPFQLAVYDFAISDTLGVDRCLWGDYYMAKNNDTTTMYPLERYNRELVASWFEQMDTAEKAGVYLPNPGDSCRTCGVSDFCLAVGGRSADYDPAKETVAQDSEAA